MKKILLGVLILIVSSGPVFSQHDHHPTQKDTVKKAPVTVQPQKKPVPVSQPKGKPVSSDTIKKPAHEHHVKEHEHKAQTGPGISGMPTHAFSLNLPMNRNASGTAWNPDATPMYMWMRQKEKTNWMFHGSVFMRYTGQDIFKSGTRGTAALSFPNWFMAMMNKKTGGRGLFNFTAMISLDRITEGGDGYPLLFQSGETWKGKRLVDRQHPHDLFSALSIGYTHMISKDMDIFAYLGYPGEPALGAPAFMHRVSSMNIPDAPLGHHWQDATHITFGAGTLGFRYKQFKLEGSIFTGREPDEERFGFDEPHFDSYSYRLSYNPSQTWALQFSQGFINSPEALEPGVDVTRTTASVLYSKQFNKEDHLSAALIWGLNNQGEHHKEHSFLGEANWQFRKNALFSRYEYIQKSKDELDLDETFPHRNFNVHAFTAGYNRILWNMKNIDIAAGTQFTVFGVDKVLQNLYGNTPLSFQVYLQFRPSFHKH